MHVPPTYEPPYDSPLEDLFALNMVKYLDESVRFDKQFAVATLCGDFRLDFLAQKAGRKIAFECDGQQFHGRRRGLRDEWRDGMILRTALIDVIYRVRGKDLFYHMEDCLFVLSRWEDDLFSERGKINLKRLASDRVREYESSEDDLGFSCMYPEESKSFDNPIGIWIERRLQKSPSGTRQHWELLYGYAVEHGGGNLDDLVTCRMQDILQNPDAMNTFT